MLSVVTRWFALGAAYAWFDWATQFKDEDGYVGPRYFNDYASQAKAKLRSGGSQGGLIPTFDELACDEFEPRQVNELIRHFYRHSSTFTLRIVRNQWNPRLRCLANLWAWGARRVGQLRIPIGKVGSMESDFELLDIDDDGRYDFVCWIRRLVDEHGQGRTLFYTGAFRPFFSVVDGKRGAYLACAFPLPGANIAAVLKFHNTPSGGFRASSLPAPSRGAAKHKFPETETHIGSREAGTYLVVPFRRSLCIFPALGLQEDLRFHASRDARGPLIRGRHRCFWLGMSAFRLDYVIRPKPARERTSR